MRRLARCLLDGAASHPSAFVALGHGLKSCGKKGRSLAPRRAGSPGARLARGAPSGRPNRKHEPVIPLIGRKAELTYCQSGVYPPSSRHIEKLA